MKIKTPLFAFLICALIFTGFFLANNFDTQQESSTQEFQLTALNLVDLSTEPAAPPITLEQTRGKNLILHIWASWCGVCKAERPVMKKIWDKIKESENVRFLAAATNDSLEDVKASPSFQNKLFPIAFDPEDNLAETLSIDSVPTTVVFNAEGKLLHRFSGRLKLHQIEKIISYK